MTDKHIGGAHADTWTLHAPDRALIGNKSGVTHLGFALLLKLFQADGRFPRRAEDVGGVPCRGGRAGIPNGIVKEARGRPIRTRLSTVLIRDRVTKHTCGDAPMHNLREKRTASEPAPGGAAVDAAAHRWGRLKHRDISCAAALRFLRPRRAE